MLRRDDVRGESVLRADDRTPEALEQEIARLNAKVAALDAETRRLKTAPQSIGDDQVTERGTQWALTESEARYRDAFERSTVGHSQAGPDGKLLKVNQAFADMLGLSIEELQQVAIADITHPDDVAETLASIRCLLANERTTYRMDKRYWHRDGHLVYADVSITLLRDSVGAPHHFVATIVDITERKLAEQRILERNALLNAVLESVDAATFSIDRAFCYTGFNRAYADLMQAMCAVVVQVGASLAECRTATGVCQISRTSLERALQGQTVVDSVTSGDEGQSRRDFEVTYNPVLTDAGEIIGASTFIRDVTAKKQAEQALKNSEAELRAVLDTTPFPVALVDAQDQKIEFWSRSALTLFGHTAPTAPEWYQIAYPDPDYRREVVERWRPALEMARVSNQPVNTGEYRVTCSDGSARTCELYAAFLSGRLIVTFNDITERKRAEETLREKEFLLSESQRLGHIGSWFWDMQGPISWSDELYRLFGVSPDAFIPAVESFLSLIHPDDRSAMQAWVAARASNEDPGELEFRVIMPNGAIHHFRGRGQSVHDVGNSLLHMAGTVQDITDQKFAAIEREQLEEQLKISQKLEAIGRLAGGVAHDFNNLLSVILLYTGFAMDEASDSVKNDIIEVKKAADRGVALVQQLLAFSRKQVLQPVPLDLSKVIARLETMLRRVLGEDIDLVQVLAPNLGLTLADPGQIEQVLMNLVLNARDAMPGGGHAHHRDRQCRDRPAVRSIPDGRAQPGSYVQLVITDTGRGMDEPTRARIFEPFFTTKEHGHGHGPGSFHRVWHRQAKRWQHLGRQRAGPGRRSRSICRASFRPARRRPACPADFKAGRGSGKHSGRRGRRGAAPGRQENPRCGRLQGADRRERCRSALDLCAAQGRNPAACNRCGHAADERQNRSREELLKARPTLKVLYMSGYTDNIIDQHGVLPTGTQFIGKPFTSQDLTRKVREVLDLT